MIIITGANGQLGRAVVAQLLARVPAAQIGVSVRDPEQARTLTEQGVRVRRGDFEDAASLAYAFEGVSRVLIISSNGLGDTAVRHHRRAIDAATAAGARRILYTSHMGSSPSSPFPPMRDHAATEAALQESGVPFTALHNGFYAASAAMMLNTALQTGELAVPEDGPVAWTAHADLAEIAAIALTQDSLNGVTPALTAAAAFDMSGLAEIASELTGRAIRRRVVSEADYRAGLVARGVPASAADMFVGLFAASRRGDFAPADPTLTRLLGHPLIPVRDVLQAAISRTG